MIVNVRHVPGSDSLEKTVSATVHSVFPRVMRDVVSNTNSLVVGGAGSLSGARILAERASLPTGLARVDASVGERLGPALRGAAVYTDDRAPVEWLTDLAIVRYAAGQR